MAPAVITRDEAGRATLRAVRVASPLRVDGRLDEEVYVGTAPISGFYQREPNAGAPATDKTEVWLLFDDQNVYVSARVWEEQPERRVAFEMRHDNASIYNGGDNLLFILDTFYDRRNGVSFSINPLGGHAEGQVTNERAYNGDYNLIWNVRVGNFENGWTFEAAVPFKSLRYRAGTAQIWGFNASREVRWKNESSYLVPMPNALGVRALMQLSLAPTVVGIEVPSGAKNLELKPYAISDLTSDVTARPQIRNDAGGDAGLDVKYGVTQNLTADFTYNTDFAQVEADEQQINLTRFSLFFPEKRDFFLENRGTFDFGASGGSMNANTDTPTLFYSRRIGLHLGRSVPILAGGRLTGRTGRYSLGVLNIQTEEDAVTGAAATNFSVARLRRDILRRSSVGVLATRRSIRERGTGANEAYGVDGTFAFFDNLTINTYWARTHTDGLTGDDTSYRAHLDYAGDRYGVQLERLGIGDNFNPEIGFLRRDDMHKDYAQFRFSPRPRQSRIVRKYSWIGSITRIENGRGRLETRDWDGEFGIEFQNSDKFTISYNDLYEFLPAPFAVGGGVLIPVGGYDFGAWRVSQLFGQQRRLAGTVAIEWGSFYGGERTTLAVTGGRVEVTPQFSLQPTISMNWIDLPQAAFTTNLIGTRVTYTMTPRMFASALVQYNSGVNAVASNVRFRWEYRPGSELFIVYNETRDTLATSFPGLLNRAVIVKINRLFRF